MAMERIIGRYTGAERGPLLLCLGGLHGNEPAGVHALEIVFQMLEREPEVNPGFVYRGRLLGLRGNLQALEKGLRYIEQDLNRMWTSETVERVLQAPPGELHAEERELRELLLLIRQELAEYQPEKFVVLDIHTTTAFGGIFSLATDDPESLRIAVNLHAPVITGMLQGIRGTTMHYFNNEHFEPQTVPVVFEAGQHQEELSVNRAIAAIINCMR
ncbi:MAG: succinylglutamate desuccinylase, partial [Bacteroidetes bacterium]